MSHKNLCTGYVVAPSEPEATDPYEAAEALQTFTARIAAIATVAASGETDTLPRHLHAELLGLLADVAKQANEAAEALTVSLADWLNRAEGTR
jgi:hypothetical protein